MWLAIHFWLISTGCSPFSTLIFSRASKKSTSCVLFATQGVAHLRRPGAPRLAASISRPYCPPSFPCPFTKRDDLEERPPVPMPPFQGSITALITPFKDGKVDARAFQKLVEWQIDQGTHGLVPCGTTGESPTLTHDEHRRVVELCIEAAAGRVPVIAGTGSNSTSEAIALTRFATKAGADGALVVTPYYNKPTQEGLYLHYKAINDAVDIPIIIYNIPGRSIVDMSVDTMARLFKLPNIAGVKDATANMARVSQ